MVEFALPKHARVKPGRVHKAPPGATAVGTSGTGDADPLTRWARQVLPTVEQHLERAQQLQQNIK